ncbi:hypothetical protein KVP09_15020, partial [Alcaligenaceae bacterium CGII-47]|nr:hypothetical protein [Alcaligenaceae bacterium CGII-47]MBV6274211.1 hypothetical protein [Alcaligenaceae bacterium CGII-47]
LKGRAGDAIHAVLCAVGFNMKWLLRMIARKGVLPFFLSLFYVLIIAGVSREAEGADYQGDFNRLSAA